MTAIAFDDIDAINAQASEEYGEWGDELVVTQEMINQFADLTGDHQWIHVDVERCKKESPFGGPIAHGFLTLSLMPSLISMPVQLTGMKNVVNFGSGGLQFRRPGPAGATPGYPGYTLWGIPQAPGYAWVPWAHGAPGVPWGPKF